MFLKLFLKGLLIFFISFANSIFVFGQDKLFEKINSIKNNDNYLWGEGEGILYETAKTNALANLSSKISTQIEVVIIDISNQKNNKLNQNFYSCVKTFSNIALQNVEEFSLKNENETNFKVFVYLKKSEINEVFEQRKQKIFSFIKLALEDEEKLQIGDAIRYFYWSLQLIKSMPYPNSIMFKPKDNTDSYVASTFIDDKLNDIFSNIKVQISKKVQEKNSHVQDVYLNFTYQQQPITNLDFSYHNGERFEPSNGCKDGVGLLELITHQNQEIKDYVLNIEFEYKNQALTDKEVELVLEQVPKSNFSKSRIIIKSASIQHPDAINVIHIFKPSVPQLHYTEQQRQEAESVLQSVSQAINSGSIANVKNQFDAQSWSDFQKINQYGKLKLLNTDSILIEPYNSSLILRNFKVQFSVKNNTRKFVEDLVFTYDTIQKKIVNITMGLNKVAYNSIMENSYWDMKDKQILVQALENYKTAYCLKDINFIKSIFADDAIIIVGKALQIDKNADPYSSETKEIIKTNRYTKDDYIKNLEKCFKSNEFINIHFEKSTIEKQNRVGSYIYGVQIEQNYYSDSYGDRGHLFLIMDLSDSKKPIIKVRTWQDKTNTEHPPYKLSDF